MASTIRYKLVSTSEELQQILSLQKDNLPISLSEGEKKKEGFLTVHHDLDLLQRMNNACPHIIAKDGDTIVGYALSMHPKFGDEIEVLIPMFEQLNVCRKRQPEKEFLNNFLIMGQVCVAKTHRKRGVFRRLYQTMLKEHIPPFSCIVTEVNHKNTRSMEAHYAIGFQLLTEHRSGGQDWALIYLK
ncbi:MAG: GNAT family N-acetyltransferase [Bacteroidota bacterium]